jgi:glutamyl/glutaminyl-tRNA synthetase
MANTRFAPTLNGQLHLGHLFTMLVNEYIAHSTGGKFYIRMEDADYLVRIQLLKQTMYILESQQEDIEWLELKVDGYEFQSEQLDVVKKFLELPENKKSMIYEKDCLDFVTPLVIRMGTDWAAIPYVPQQTAERVVMDYNLGITHVIRGDDFVTEYSLYSYFCERFGFPIPVHIFLSRLIGIKGEISKTNGGYKIADFRNEGYSAKELKQMITKACTIYPLNGFELYNIKSNPRINL